MSACGSIGSVVVVFGGEDGCNGDACLKSVVAELEGNRSEDGF